MSDTSERDNCVSLLKNLEIIQDDGTTRKISDEEAQDMWESLDAASVRSEQERPRMEKVIERLNEKIPDLHIEQIGGYVPIQGHGTYQGEEFYFRSRWAHASLSVGSTDGEDVNSWNAKRRAQARVTAPGDEFGAGWLTPEEVELVFPVLIANLEFRTQEDNDREVESFRAGVDAIVEKMKENKDASQ